MGVSVLSYISFWHKVRSTHIHTAHTLFPSNSAAFKASFVLYQDAWVGVYGLVG